MDNYLMKFEQNDRWCGETKASQLPVLCYGVSSYDAVGMSTAADVSVYSDKTGHSASRGVLLG